MSAADAIVWKKGPEHAAKRLPELINNPRKFWNTAAEYKPQWSHCLFFLVEWGLGPRALLVLGKHSTAFNNPSSCCIFICNGRVEKKIKRIID